MNIVGVSICISYFIIAFCFLFFLEKNFQHISKEERRSLRIDSGIILCSVLWIFFIIVVFVNFFIRIFNKEE